MKTTAKKKAKVQRNKYSIETKEKARKYYLMGLNLPAISKLLDNVPVKTLEKWRSVDSWTDIKKTKGIKQRTIELSEAGKTGQEIADILKISRVSVWRYIKEAKTANK